MTGPIAIAVSGGIDSLVAAYLLRQAGHDVFGIHFLTGYEKHGEPGWPAIRDRFHQMGLEVHIVDLKAAFTTHVVEYFARSYGDGQTPNPCLVCNPMIKFGELLAAARRWGAARMATGHYARVGSRPGGRYWLRKGVDSEKDQSYFLCRLTQDQLARACFPLGEWTKKHVRELAAEKGLQPIHRKESQDVCFLKGDNYVDFLDRNGTVGFEPGEIVDTAGVRVGAHHGLHRYTVGQRRGINCPASQAYYVVRIDTHKNRLVVGFKDALYTRDCQVTGMNWIAAVPEGPMTAETRIRYRHAAAASLVSPCGQNDALVRFEHPQLAVTPGQGAVFYRGDEVIGGGWIMGFNE